MIYGFLTVVCVLVLLGAVWLLGYKQSEKNTADDVAQQVPIAAPDWLPVNRLAWSNFLQSEHGKILLARGRAIEFETARAACKEPFHVEHSAGKAAGFKECLDWLESLSRSSRVPDDSRSESEQTDTEPTGEPATVN